MKLLLTLAVTLLFSGCTQEAAERFRANLAQQHGYAMAPAPTYAPVTDFSAPPPVTTTRRLMLFGGEGHRVFLGCVTDGKFASDSIYNEFGTFGSKFSGDSIWNEFGTYGSKFSDYSPWNQFANNPPVVVDEQGGFYGYFTANQFHANRTNLGFLLALIAAHQ